MRAGEDDDGECIASKAGYALTGVGGSNAAFEPMPMGAIFPGNSFDPAWMAKAPTALVNGKRMAAVPNTNAKGGMTDDMMIWYLEEMLEPTLDPPISPDDPAVLFCDLDDASGSTCRSGRCST